MMSEFRASDYADYNAKHGFDKYKDLYLVMEELFTLLPFNENDFEDDDVFEFSGLTIYIDKKFGSYCEIKGTGWYPIEQRLEMHKKVVEIFKQDIIQLSLF